MGFVVRNLWTFFGDELFECALSDRSEDRGMAGRNKFIVVTEVLCVLINCDLSRQIEIKALS